MNLPQETYAAMTAHLDRIETEAITQALCRALEIEDCEPRDYLPRLSAQHRGGGIRYVMLDGQDLICLFPVKTEWAHDEMICTLQHKYVWQGNKKPAEAGPEQQ